MARINIEDTLFRDGRFLELTIKMGSRHAALGATVEAFMIAQEFYLNKATDRLIPLNEWKRRKAVDYVIEVGLAEIRGEYIYVFGSDKQFAWLAQRSDAGAKGGRPKTQKTPDQIKPEEKKADESGRLTDESGSNPLTLTLSLTPTLSQDLSQTQTLSQEELIPSDPVAKATVSATKKQKLSKEDSEINAQIWSSYKEAYVRRYKTDPVRNLTVNGQISNLRKRLGKEAIDVVAFFVNHNEGFYVKNCHPIGLCLKDAESLRTQWFRNIQVTSAKVRNFERMNSQVELAQEAEKGGF